MVAALIGLMSRSSAPLVLFRIEDLGTLDRPLIVLEDPGYPQWKVKTIPSFEEMIDLETTQLVLDQLQSERGCFFDLVDVSFNQEDPANKQVTIPSATYRLQLHRNFKFADAHKLVDYLDKLGISHYYLSPISQSRPGSMHGYDVISHSTLNPELGNLEDLESLSADLKKREMGIIMDLVPNHMGIGKHNPWWMDVLEHGPASEYGQYFDIDWSPVKDELMGKVLLPVLGEPYGKDKLQQVHWKVYDQLLRKRISGQPSFVRHDPGSAARCA
jgi:(1->4)-alpha-D-glucan 1-alpha-D-glucosylmutase